jgi:asparagine synthase (glutamine-hydrolysing)
MMSDGAPATIVIRANGPTLNVTGPATFLGGFPVIADGERDGSFGEWRWNGEQLDAQVDRLGMFPLYYSELPDGIALSTSISDLIKAGASSEIDWTALHALFRLGFCIGNDTVFRAIKTFPVGGKLNWTPGRLHVTESFPEIKLNTLSRSDAIDAYLDLFRTAMRRRVVEGAPIRLPLSGGRDSRHILLELVRMGSLPVGCYTSSYSTMQNDVRVAREVCAGLGVPHRESRIPETDDIVRTELKKNELMSFQAVEHGWCWLLAETMADAEAISYDGIDGDVLSAGHFHDDENSRLYRAGRFEDLARRMAPATTLVLLPAGWQEAATAADLHGTLITELLRYQHTQNPMMFFFLYNRSRRAVSPTIHRLYGHVLRAVYAPFLDRDVFDFLAGLPEEMFVDRMFHTQAIARAFPGVGELAYAKKTSIPPQLQRRYARQGFRFALGATSLLLDKRALVLRMARSLLLPRYGAEANWALHQAVMLYQLGKLQMSAN